MVGVLDGPVGVWTPRRLPGLVGWWRLDLGAYEEAARTTPAGLDGDPVGGLQDWGPAGNHLGQATASKKLTLKVGASGLNGRAIGRADGVDDHLSGGFDPGASGLTVLAAARTGASVPVNQVLLGSGGPGATSGIRWAFALGTDATFGMGWAAADGSLGLGSGAGVAANTAYVCAWRTNRTAWAVRRNGAQIATPADSSFPGGSWSAFVAMESAVSWPFLGDLGELIVCAAVLSDAELARAERYLGRRWGVVLP